MAEPDAEGEAATTRAWTSSACIAMTVRVARIGRHDRRAEFDRVRLAAREGERHHRIAVRDLRAARSRLKPAQSPPVGPVR